MLLDIVREGLARNPGAPAFVFRDRVLSAGRFHGLYCETARRLRDAGVQMGDTVGISLDQSPVHCAVILALARLGAISVPLHPASSREQRGRLAERFGVRRVVCAAGIADLPGRESIRLEKLTMREDDDDRDISAFAQLPETPARIALTSGTTGAPGAVLYTHGYWSHRVLTTVDAVSSGSRVIPVDLHLTLGNLFAFGALAAGGTVVFPRGRAAKDLVDAINLHAATHVLLPPGTVSAMVPHLPAQGMAFPSLRHLRLIGGRVSRAMQDMLRLRFSPNFCLPYGISETGPIAMADAEMLADEPDSSGVARAGVAIEVVDEQGVVLPAGSSGEIRVNVPGMPTAYFDDPQRSAERFRDGWYHTGDIGHLDAVGRIFIEGRADDRINVGGRKFQPAPLESMLQECPGIREAALFAMESEAGMPVLAAAVVCDSEESLRALPPFCRERGFGALTPRRYYRVRRLPRNPMGKLLRADVPRLVAGARKQKASGADNG
jgi:acyl-coenzyme A synthetase/AMP-(fatty) acid ligase